MAANKKNNYLFFTKKEKTGSLFLLFIIFLISAMPIVYAWFKKDSVFDAETYSNEIENLNRKQTDSGRQRQYQKSETYSNRNYPKQSRSYNKQSDRFSFDPNHTSIEDWMRMGVSEKTAVGIQNYISKGGSFRKPEDLKKVWGIPTHLAEELLPYVNIQQQTYTPTPYKNEREYGTHEKKIYTPKEILPVDINQADSMNWVALPAIGPALSKRILNYKEKLGGFHTIEQIREVYGITDSSFQVIKPYLQISTQEIKKININTATLDELKTHPYIRYRLANAIVEFRNQHGPYSSVASLKKIMLITDEVLMRMAPYLIVQ